MIVKTEIPQRSEEAQVPPRGKRVTVAQWNERVQTNKKIGTASVRLLEAIILLCPKLFFFLSWHRFNCFSSGYCRERKWNY
ncbi:hypothetical protein [Priestia flexa]|uniref:hypothetical protein n=1 Tax=Priestia flexa TaxID=86664 RepID=UPI0012684155|nr:hypothetical protein [Priestia flexa]